MIQWTSLPPLLTHWTKLQFDLRLRTLLHFNRSPLAFLRLQELGVAPDAIFHILPGIECVTARSQAPNHIASMLIGRSGRDAIGKLAVFFFGHGHHRDIGQGMVIVYLIIIYRIISSRISAPIFSLYN